MFEGFLGIIIGICAIVITIAWIILPFAVFGIKKRLDLIYKEASSVSIQIAGLRHDLNYDDIDPNTVQAKKITQIHVKARGY